ncbi:MAG: S1C family serine protease [Clostridia bacterium]|nr:S1C family serine protease [Clostridia bacterium]
MKRVWKIILSLAIVFSISAVTLLAGCSDTGDSYINITAGESGTDSESSSGSSGSSEATDSTGSSNTTGDSGNSSSDSSSNTITSLTASGLNVEYEVATSSSDTYSVAENLLSVVTVYSDTQRTYGSSGSIMQPSSNMFTYRDVSTGSGVIFSIDDDNDGYVYFVTCYHVVYNEDEEQIADEIYVYLYGSVDGAEATSTKRVGSTTYCTAMNYGGDAITCEYVGGSLAEDVAVLKAEKQDVLDVNDSVRAVTFAEDYSVGDDAVAIGNYAGAGISVTKGSVAVDSEKIDLTFGSTTNEYKVMRLDLNIYGGNSGGGLFDANGYYIGMVNAMSTVYTNYTFAIPASKVIDSIENIIYYYTDTNEYDMYTADLGLTVKVAGSVYVYDETTDTGCIKEEVAIASVTTGSAAESMGLETGDIITSITVDGTEYAVTRTFVVEEIGLISFVDSVVTVSYTRSGTAYTTSEYTVTTDCIVSH